ncbi:hypothetical protein HanXRQr2_Chr05g0204511 [Helianthus annuus]|uniref:Uncharacterized protein n=1 Tax=Helianthus annuus TaxID=4232 RepID=A0A9K3NMD4_HELAN|nr:hypothetical protein HanXRQr2_Chr05g0204511 [Helianthus annuus]KAJ0921905.1 hypothetical protein HanPSC8_Chr05g0197191 [Helianthus annuus]
MMLRNKKDFSNLTLSKFIEKLEAQEMEQRKISRMKDFDGEQDISLYYKGGISDKTNMSPKVETTFNAKNSSGGSSKGSNSKTSFSSYPSFDPNLSTKKNGKVIQCNIALNLENDQDYSEEVAKSHMSLLVTVLESYGSLVAGRIGNPMLTKEDYDQIDPVIKRKVKEVPAFKVDAEADAQKIPVKYENCEAVKKQNNTLMC